MNTLDIFRPGNPATLQASVSIDEKTIYSKKLMGEHVVTTEFFSENIQPLQLGDFIVIDGETFVLNRLPDVEELSATAFLHTATFTGTIGELSKKLLISIDGLADFSYTGNANDFISLIVGNMGIGWSVGVVASTEITTLQFSNEYCSTALTRVAEFFKLEYDISGKAINMLSSIGDVKNLTFEYGRNSGLYNLKRQQVQDQNILTKVYGFGGTKNIPSGYRTRAKRLIFDGRFLTKNTDLYGVIEGIFTNDEIYPKRTSTVTGANVLFDAGESGTDFNNRASYVEDTTLDFDINSYLIEGQTAKIIFKTGDLANVECEIWKYDHATKRIYFSAYTDTDGYTLPRYNEGATIEPRTGDSYTLVNISMPQSYIDEAETKLQTETQAYIDKNCVPQVIYLGTIDPKFARANNIKLSAGDKVTVIDSKFGINTQIRISGVSYPLVDKFKITAIIADFVPYTTQERIIQAAATARREAVYTERRNAELVRRNTVRQTQLKDLIFDTDGYFDSDNIKPLSINTTYLSVGTKSSNFGLNGVVIIPNYTGDQNAFYVSGGQLIHYQIDISGNYTWVISNPLSVTGLDPNLPYYLYAKCSKTDLVGSWDLSTVQKQADGNDGYYYFLTGILYAVYNGARDYDFTYGMTYINGRVITTGRIRSVDGLNYFDLDQNQFMIGDANHSLDWNVTHPGVLTLRGAMVQSEGGGEGVLPVWRGAYSATETYYYGEQVTYNGTLWVYINPVASRGNIPQSGPYWEPYVTSGQDGKSIIWKGEFATLAALISALGQPQIGWAYRNTTAKQSYVFDGQNWTKMTEDGAPGQNGTNGTIQQWKGEFADLAALIAAFGQPQTGWTYRNTTLKGTFIFQDDTWYQMNFDGLQGDPGTPGTPGQNGQNGLSIVWHGDAAIPDPSWQILNHAYRDTNDGIVYIWNSAAWEVMVKDGNDGVDGTNGTNGMNVYITYHNNSISSQPATPTGDGTTGGWHTAPSVSANWMSQKVAVSASSGTWGSPLCITGADGQPGINGTNGQNGTNGTNGTNAYLHIAWANDELGTNFSTSSSAGRAYMGTYTDSNVVGSQDYAAYNWILVKGADGANGPMLSFRGTFSALATYQNNSTIRTVVKYGDAYYLYNGIDGGSGAWNAGQWSSFGANFSSVATELLLAEMSTIENLYSQYFHSIANPAGNLAGSVETIQANNAVPQSQVDMISRNSTPGDCTVTYDGHIETMAWQGDAATTVSFFVQLLAPLFAGWGIELTNSGAARCSFRGPAGVAQQAATITPGYGAAWTEQPAIPITAQIDKITLSGTSGKLNIAACGISKVMDWTDGTLPNTINAFIDAYYNLFLSNGGIITSINNEMFIEASTAGVPLPQTSCYNIPNPYRGAMKIQGNEIWENEEANSTYGSIVINRRGYKGGDLYYRDVLIGDGKGTILFGLYGNATGGSLQLHVRRLLLDNLPTSGAGLTTGELYRDGTGADAYLRIK